MDEVAARERLERMVAHDVDPVLSTEEVEDLFEQAKRIDGEGRTPSDADWEPTFDLNAAAAEGWSWKAGKVAPRYGVNLDGAVLQRQQLYAHCRSQSAHYANKIVGSLGVRPATPPVEESFQ